MLQLDECWHAPYRHAYRPLDQTHTLVLQLQVNILFYDSIIDGSFRAHLQRWCGNFTTNTEMSWAANEWKDGLPPRALQKIAENEKQLERLKKELHQKEFQLDSLKQACIQ